MNMRYGLAGAFLSVAGWNGDMVAFSEFVAFALLSPRTAQRPEIRLERASAATASISPVQQQDTCSITLCHVAINAKICFEST